MAVVDILLPSTCQKVTSNVFLKDQTKRTCFSNSLSLFWPLYDIVADILKGWIEIDSYVVFDHPVLYIALYPTWCRVSFYHFLLKINTP